MTTDTEPQEPTFIKIGHAKYNGRDFFGDGMGCNGHADTRAELTYLRDWQAWARRQLGIVPFSGSEKTASTMVLDELDRIATLLEHIRDRLPLL